MNPNSHINLRMPTDWNELTPREMEKLSKLYAARMPEAVFRVRVLLMLAGIRFCRKHPHNADGTQLYALRRAGLWHYLFGKRFYAEAGQLQHMATAKLDWIFAECDRIEFPYRYLRLRSKLTALPGAEYSVLYNIVALAGNLLNVFGRKFRGPDVYMQDFSWKQYKQASDFLTVYQQLYQRLQSNLSKPEKKTLTKQAALLRNLFLATVFTPRLWHIDAHTRTLKYGYKFMSEQSTRNARYFASVTDDQFQAILFFWQGVAAYLQKSYPKLYNGGKPSKAHTDLLKSEAEITETLKSRMHLSTPQVEAEPYNHVLENLSRLMEEAEAMKKATKGMK